MRSYAALTPSFSTNELQNSAFTFYNEMRASTGIDLARIMRVRNGGGAGRCREVHVLFGVPARLHWQQCSEQLQH